MKRSNPGLISPFLSLVALILATPVFSQVNTSNIPPSDEELEELDAFIVEGYRGQVRASTAAKRDADGIVDVLTIDEFGRVPDPNIADALQRLPGVLSILGTDEGRYVTIRGVDSQFTGVTMNGSSMAAIDRTRRRVVTDPIPPSAVTGIELHKTLTPGQDGNAIGGSINLQTHSAFQVKQNQFISNLEVGNHDSQFLPADDKISYNGDFSYSTQFGEDSQFGVVVYGNYFSKTRDESRSNRTNGFINDLPYVRNVIPLGYENSIDRYSVGGRLEFKPSEHFYTYLAFSKFNADYFVTRYNQRLDGSNATLTQNGDSGTFGEARSRPSTNQFPFEQKLTNVQFYAEFNPAFEGKFEFRASSSTGKLIEENYGINFDAGTSPDFSYSYDFTDTGPGDLAGLTYANPAAIDDLSRYNLTTYQTLYSEMEETVSELRLDYMREPDPVDGGLGFSTGVLYRNLDREFDRTQVIYTYNGPESLTYDRFGFTDGYNPEKTPGIQQQYGDVDAFRNFFDSNFSDFEETSATARNSARADYSVDESIFAAYLSATYAIDRWSLIGGLRGEQTDVETTSFFVNEGNFEVAHRELDYSDLLPSALLRYHLKDDGSLRINLAYYRATGRPDHPSLAQTESRDTAADGTIIITRGNPDLEARQADNLDLSLDWFIGQGEFISIAVFTKNIKNEIFNTITDDIVDGTPVEIVQPVNISDAQVSGLEFSFSDDQFEFLPSPFDGLGLFGNFTFLSGEIDIPNADGSIARTSENLQEQPEFVANLSLLYSIGKFDARLAYNYRDDYYFRLRQNPAQDRVELALETWDINLRYRFSDNLSASLEGRNIFDAFRSNSESGLRRSTSDWGGSIWLGLNYRY